MNRHTVLICFLLLTPLYSENRLELTIDECVAYALEHSPDFAIKKLKKASQELDVQAERAALDPVLKLQTGKQFNEPDSHNSSIGVEKTFHGGWDLGVQASNRSSQSGQKILRRSITLSKALLKNGSVLESRQSLDNSLVALLMQNNTLSLAARELTFQIKKQAYGILRTMETLKIQKLRLERSQQNLKHAIEREEPMDIATAQLEVPSSEIRVLSAEMKIASDLDTLKVMIGMHPLQELNLVPEWNFAFSEFDLARDIPSSLETHEDHLNQKLLIEKNQRLIRIAKRRRWPSVSLQGSFADSSSDGFQNFETNEESLSLNFSWPLGGRVSRISLAMAENVVKRDELGLKKMELAKTKVLRQLARQLEEQKQSIHLQEKQVELRKLQVELFQDRWNEGEIDILEFVRNQNELENSKVNVISRRIEYLELVERYRFEAGIGVQEEK
ncbi:MAG: TolC family protein [Planctomycetes bacterium]|nr:TolC family protein [Planctomycetota bacterium]